MNKKTKIGFISLGCPKNQVDTEIMLHELVEAGYELTGEDVEADIIIVNTCAFIDDAKKESIDNILDVAWLKKNRGLKGIIVCGCLSERYREEVFKELPEVDALIGVGAVGPVTYPNGDTCRFMDTAVRCVVVASSPDDEAAWTPRVNDEESTEVGWFQIAQLPPMNLRVRLVIADAVAQLKHPTGFRPRMGYVKRDRPAWH